jgi:hypothetical protein
MELKNYELALGDFQTIMEKDPNNAEANGDLKLCRSHLEKQGGGKGFKKINIVEEESENDSENEEQNTAKFEEFVARHKDNKTKATTLIKEGQFP